MHYNGANSYLFVNSTEFIKFKAKYSEINGSSLCLGNISKTFFADKFKKIYEKSKMDTFMILVLIMMLLQLMLFRQYLMYLMKKKNII